MSNSRVLSTPLFLQIICPSRGRAFRSVEAQENYPVASVSHSSSGDRFIVGTGSCQPKVFDREGKEIIKFAKGDM
jgi:WD repeat-containing protein 70